MRTSWLAGIGGVGILLGAAPAQASGCGGYTEVASPAPTDAVVFSIKECCGGWSQPSSGQFLPIVETEDGEVDDPERDPVPVTFTDEAGLRIGRGDQALSAGDWRFQGTNEYGHEHVVRFEVDPELAATPQVPELTLSETYSGGGYDVYSEDSYPVAYVEFEVEFEGPAFAVEIYPVELGERALEPLVTAPSSYPVITIGEPPDDCQGVFRVPTAASYDVRAAAYAANGEIGPWSDFERIDVPAMPTSGCTLSPRGVAPPTASWAVPLAGVLMALGCVLRRSYPGRGRE